MQSFIKQTQRYLSDYIIKASEMTWRKEIIPFELKRVPAKWQWNTKESFGDFSSTYALVLTAGKAYSATQMAILLNKYWPTDHYGWIKSIHISDKGYINIDMHRSWFEKNMLSLEDKLRKLERCLTKYQAEENDVDLTCYVSSAIWRGHEAYQTLLRIACVIEQPCKYQWHSENTSFFTCHREAEIITEERVKVQGIKFHTEKLKQNSTVPKSILSHNSLKFIAFQQSLSRAVRVDESLFSRLHTSNPYYGIQYLQSRLRAYFVKPEGHHSFRVDIDNQGYYKQILKLVLVFFDVVEEAYNKLQIQRIPAYLIQLSVLTLNWSIWQNHTGKKEFYDDQLLDMVYRILVSGLKILGIKPAEKM